MTHIPFTKAHGAGNDFVILDAAYQRHFPTQAEKRRLCNRHFGVGADGLMFLSVPGSGGADADLRLFNSDGGEAEISGNGTRCAAAFLLHVGNNRGSVVIHTQAGTKTLRLISRRGSLFQFEMEMGSPVLSAADIPFCPPGSTVEPVMGFPLPLSGGERVATITSMGNPHCSIQVRNYDWDWKAAGSEIETHPYFPRRTNVEFYRLVGGHEIEVRFWERGVGETLSSGTGSCAAAVAAMLSGKVENPVTVRTLGGVLQVRQEVGTLYLTGPAEIICQGEYLNTEHPRP